jgi:hypothetical protein
MSIVLFLFDWFCVNWFVCKSFLIQKNFLFDSGGTSIKHFLKLFSFNFGFSNCLNMFTIFINCWVFSFFLFFFCFFFSSVFRLLFCFFSCRHFCPWFFIRHQFSSGCSNSGSLVDISCSTNWSFLSFCSWCWCFFNLLFLFSFSSLTFFNCSFLLNLLFSWSCFLCRCLLLCFFNWCFFNWLWSFFSWLLLSHFFWSWSSFFSSLFLCRFWLWFFLFYLCFCLWCLFLRCLFCWSGLCLLLFSSRLLFSRCCFFCSWSLFCWCFRSSFSLNLSSGFFAWCCFIILVDTTLCLCQNHWFTSEIHMN